ncbi:MAG: bifunctional DNA-formamidopyrimidine glycosylase/DNA-(apurinic or apyrimidinic site) lyase [bacterium]
MPELPEVETMRRRLAPLLVGKTIIGASVKRADIIGHPSAAQFCRGVRGRRIGALSRRGKYLIIGLGDGRELVLHMRLSGHLEIVGRGEHPDYERLRLELDGGSALSFAEPRVLGRAYLVSAGRYPPALAGMLAMGPEPVGDGWSADYLARRLFGRKASVKSLLLDQRVCCGVGNIYSDEALFRARVRPLRPAGRLKRDEVRRLADGLRDVIAEGINWCGTTLVDRRYVQPDGAAGGFQEHLAVFGREGEACRRCGSRIRRARVGNRSTHYCPACQK